MTYLVDTNVLGGLANRTDAKYGVALRAAIELHRRGEILHLSPQVLIEFRSIARKCDLMRARGGGDCAGCLFLTRRATFLRDDTTTFA